MVLKPQIAESYFKDLGIDVDFVEKLRAKANNDNDYNKNRVGVGAGDKSLREDPAARAELKKMLGL